jgi:quinol monooxygenase YgiN
MINEIAEIDVMAGHEAAFETAVAEAAPHFKAARGCRSFALNRSVELPQRYRLVVGWDSVDDHMVHFRESEGFKAWRALVGPHFASLPRVEHVTAVIDGF